jgi:CheY-like chemotaxis protein
MKVLVVEDDDNKRDQLVSFLRFEFPDLICEEARSYQSGLKALLTSNYEVVFLDMTMPTFDRNPDEPGGRIRPFAGRDILAQLVRKKKNQTVIVFTGFEVMGDGGNQLTSVELDRELQETYAGIYHGLIYYNAASNDWKQKVLTLINDKKL